MSKNDYQQHIDFNLYPQHLEYCLSSMERALEKSQYDRVLIHSGEPALCFLDDRYMPYVVNPHFVWWTPLKAPHCGLVLESGKKPVLYNYQPIDYWHAAPPVPESWWADYFDIHDVSEPEAWLNEVADSARLAVIGDAPVLAERFQNAGLNSTGLLHTLHLARTIKTPWEMGCLAAANHRAALGHQSVAEGFTSGVSEFDLQMLYLQATKHRDNDTPYGNIVALNEHAGVLHFTELSRQAPELLRSLVIDAGADVMGYASDITRTYTTQKDGVFADLIQAVDQLQLKIVNQVLVGADYRDLHVQTHHYVAETLQQLGIVRLSPEQQVESRLTSAFLPHGLGHFLGIQVHDVAGLVDDAGESIARPDGHPFLRLTRRLEAGNVLTIEPGVYFIEQLLEPWRRSAHAQAINWDLIAELKPFGGVRIEDDIVVTEAGPRNLSREALSLVQSD